MGKPGRPEAGKLGFIAKRRPVVAHLLLKQDMIKLITGFSEYPADGLAHLGDKVATNLPAITALASLRPNAPEVAAAVTNLNNAMKILGPSRAEAVKAAFDALTTILADIATNAPQVEGVTDTDLAAIGIPLVKTPTRTTNPPEAPQDLRLSHGEMQGQVKGKCRPLPGNIRVFEAQWTLDPNSADWGQIYIFPNSRSFQFDGLPRGKDIWVRARGRNSVGPGAWSDPATIMVT